MTTRYTLKDKAEYRAKFDGSDRLFTACWVYYRTGLRGDIDDPACDSDVYDWLDRIASDCVNNPRSVFYIRG